MKTAKAGEPGHPLYLPPQGSGRLDNPERFSVLYLSDNPAGAVAEVFWWARTWHSSMLRPLPTLPTSRYSLAEFEAGGGAELCDLDDPATLVDLGLRPSEVVTRDRAATQAWALRIHDSGDFDGVRWWSYHDSRWASHGVWSISVLSVVDVAPLAIDHAAIAEAADVLNRLVDR